MHIHLVSSSKISASQDKALDRSISSRKSDAAGLIIPDDMDIDSISNKRKSRTSITKISYKDESDSEGEPLVSIYNNAYRQKTLHLMLCPQGEATEAN